MDTKWDMHCWYCKKYRSTRLCAAGRPLYEAYTAALKIRDAMQTKDHSNPEYYNAWLGQVKALRAYYAHQFRQG